MTLFDDEDAEDFTGKVRRTWNGRPYVLANPDWASNGHRYPGHDDFTDKPGEHRGLSALYTRVTTWISCLEDTYSLGQHLERGVAVGMAARPSLCARANNVDLTGPEDVVKKALTEIAEEARAAAGWNEKAALGTAFHDTAQIWDEHPSERDPGFGAFGRQLSPEFRAMLAAYAEKTASNEYAHIEQGMVNDELRTYGTPDRLRYANAFQPGGTGVGSAKLRVTDIKTGRIDYGWQKMELQLACYALSALYDPDTGIRTELDIDQEFAEIVHVPYGQGTCTVHVVPIAEAIETLKTLVPTVRAWRARKPSWVPAEAPALASGVAAAWPTEAPEAL